MLTAATRAHAAATALWRGVRATDRDAAAARVDALRRKYPKAGQAELHRRLVQSKCLQAGMIGALSTSVGLIPGVGRVVGSLLGPLADAGVVTTLQAELVVEIFALYDVVLPETAEQAAVLTIAASNLGTRELGREVLQRLSRRLSRTIGGRVLVKALPLASIATSATTNVALTYVVGERAQALARMKDARLDEWPHVLRQLALLDEPKLVDWAARAARDAIGTVVATATDWRDRLASMLPDLRPAPPRRRRGSVRAARKPTRKPRSR